MHGQLTVETGGGVLNMGRGVLPRVWGKLPRQMLTVISCLHAYLSCNLLPFTLRTPGTKINYLLYTIKQQTEFSCFVPHFSLLKYKGCHPLVT